MSALLTSSACAFLGRSSPARQGRGAKDSIRNTAERHARSIAPRAASGRRGARLRRAAATAGEGRA